MTMVDVGLEQIGSYATIRLLHESSTGRAYLGKHPQRKKYVVIKLFRTPFRVHEAREAFLAHAKKLKKLKHRNIAEIQDAGFIAGTNGNEEYGYHVIQYVLEDEHAQRFVEGQQYSPVEVKRVISIVADALNYAHQTNTLHGNIHPGNLLFAQNNDILLTDFAPLPQNQEQDAALSIVIASKAFPYMAPEQLRGTPVAASDQYSLAVMAFEWLCGRRPYLANEPDALLYQQEHEPLPSPRTFNSAISPQVEQVLLKALALNPENRFSNVQKFADAYLRALMGIPMAEPSETKQTSVPHSEPVATARNTQSPVSNGAEKEIQSASPMPLARESRKVKSVAFGADSTATTDEVKVAAHSPISTSQENSDTDQKLIVPISTQSIASASTVDEIPGKKVRIEDQFAEPEAVTYAGVIETAPVARNGQYSLEETVTSDLRQGGILSRRLPGYEERAAQIEMAQLVAQSLTDEAPAIIEASTGTGKSLAYLIPIVRSGKVAIISTANKALQEQLFFKDIPFVQKHIQPFDAALVKGMANYVCLDRLEEERNGIQHLVKNRDFMRLVDIVNDPDSDFTGDFETLGFTLPADIRSKVYAERDQCTWGKCPFFKDCYVRKMKVKAGYAKVIVVNHTLLLIDAELEGFLLPERDVIVVDEAHHLEEEATRVFTVKVSYGQVTTLLAQRLLKDHSSVSLQDEAKHTAEIVWERLSQVADPGYKGRANLVEPLEEGLGLAKVIDKLANSLRQMRPKGMTEKDDQMYDMLIARTKNLATSIRTVFALDQPDKFVYYVERVNVQGRRGSHLEVFAAPLEVSSWLKERLFDKYNVICTSATLATIGPDPQKPADRGPNFVYFRRRVGLDRRDYPNVQERILPLTFDYEHNAVLYIPRHLPEPVYGSGLEAIRYTKSIASEMMKLVEASRGRAFLLFSSKRMLEEVFDEFCRSLPSHLDYPLLRQGDMTRLELTRTFRETEGAILFGLKSFWEGVDIAGEALSLVVIDKLPFDPPDDPVHEARVVRMKAAGENWFGTYVLPQTVLRLKQGLGRLLRTHDDRGVMAILDTRLHTKGYGRLILNALPPARRTTSLRDVEEFFIRQ